MTNRTGKQASGILKAKGAATYSSACFLCYISTNNGSCIV